MNWQALSVIDPRLPTRAKPGSKEKKRLLAVRAYLRLPLFLAADALLLPPEGRRHKTPLILPDA